MFFVIFGSKGKVEFKGIYWDKCKSCSKEGPISAFDAKRYFTLFFIPLIPYNSKRIIKCNRCSAEKEISKEEAKAIDPKIMNEKDFLIKYKDKIDEDSKKQKELLEKFNKFVAKEIKAKTKSKSKE
jgi:hypothetical protein